MSEKLVFKLRNGNYCLPTFGTGAVRLTGPDEELTSVRSSSLDNGGWSDSLPIRWANSDLADDPNAVKLRDLPGYKDYVRSVVNKPLNDYLSIFRDTLGRDPRSGFDYVPRDPHTLEPILPAPAPAPAPAEGPWLTKTATYVEGLKTEFKEEFRRQLSGRPAPEASCPDEAHCAHCGKEASVVASKKRKRPYPMPHVPREHPAREAYRVFKATRPDPWHSTLERLKIRLFGMSSLQEERLRAWTLEEARLKAEWSQEVRETAERGHATIARARGWIGDIEAAFEETAKHMRG